MTASRRVTKLSPPAAFKISEGVKITIDKGSVYASAADTAADASNAVTAEKK